MNIQKYSKQIKKQFPNLHWKEQKIIDHGYDHTVIILDNKLVFRFPKSLEYKKLLPSEIALLKVVEKSVDADVPNYSHISKDGSFAACQFFPGKELNPARYRRFSLKEKDVFADQLAKFLSQLHAIPKKKLSKIDLDVEDHLALHKKLVRDIKKHVYTKIKKQDKEKIEEYFKIFEEVIQQPFQSTLVHNDLTPTHILWETHTENLAVIDFSDRAIGDPAVDVSGLFAYGPKFVSRVLDLYTGPLDQNFLFRAKLYRQRVGLYLMKDSVKGTMIKFSDAYKEFQKRFY